MMIVDQRLRSGASVENVTVNLLPNKPLNTMRNQLLCIMMLWIVSRITPVTNDASLLLIKYWRQRDGVKERAMAVKASMSYGKGR